MWFQSIKLWRFNKGIHCIHRM